MTEAEAREWLDRTFAVPRETIERIDRFVAHLGREAAFQNLVAASTLASVWSRHVIDSAQLVSLSAPGRWIDLGSGAGFPGLIAATLRDDDTVLVESRRKRVEFLRESIEILGVSRTTSVIHARAETIAPRAFAIISARAFAPLETLLATGLRFAGPQTRWILPKGRGAQAELDTARRTWQGEFRIHPSITDPDSAIIVAERVRPRTER